MNTIVRQTPNISRNVTITPLGIILHHTGGSFAGAVSWCLNPTSQVSYHCIVDTNGDRTVLAQDNQRAWHAGRSVFNGRSDCNSFMLGVAVSGNTNSRQLNTQEIDSVARWCIDKMRLHNFGIDMITTHAVVSPGRKTDVSQTAERQIKQRILELLAQPTPQTPPQRTHTVVSGDTLSRIATRYNTTVQNIRNLNNLTSDLIRVGQILRV